MALLLPSSPSPSSPSPLRCRARPPSSKRRCIASPPRDDDGPTAPPVPRGGAWTTDVAAAGVDSSDEEAERRAVRRQAWFDVLRREHGLGVRRALPTRAAGGLGRARTTRERRGATDRFAAALLSLIGPAVEELAVLAVLRPSAAAAETTGGGRRLTSGPVCPGRWVFVAPLDADTGLPIPWPKRGSPFRLWSWHQQQEEEAFLPGGGGPAAAEPVPGTAWGPGAGACGQEGRMPLARRLCPDTAAARAALRLSVGPPEGRTKTTAGGDGGGDGDGGTERWWPGVWVVWAAAVRTTARAVAARLRRSTAPVGAPTAPQLELARMFSTCALVAGAPVRCAVRGPLCVHTAAIDAGHLAASAVDLPFVCWCPLCGNGFRLPDARFDTTFTAALASVANDGNDGNGDDADGDDDEQRQQ